MTLGELPKTLDYKVINLLIKRGGLYKLDKYIAQFYEGFIYFKKCPICNRNNSFYNYFSSNEPSRANFESWLRKEFNPACCNCNKIIKQITRLIDIYKKNIFNNELIHFGIAHLLKRNSSSKMFYFYGCFSLIFNTDHLKQH